MSDLSQETREAIIQEIFAGRKIPAIKLYREATGTGLKEAKDFIDTLTERLRAESPDEFQHPARAGCAGMLLLVVASGGLFFLMF